MKYLGGISVPLLGFPGPVLTQLHGIHFGLLPRPAFPSLPPHPSQQPILRSLFLPKLPKAPLISSFFVFPTTHWLGPIQGPRPPDPPSPPTGCTQWMETVHWGKVHLQPQQGPELSAIPLPSPRRRSFTHAPGPLTTTYSGTTNPLLQEVTSAPIPLKPGQRWVLLQLPPSPSHGPGTSCVITPTSSTCWRAVSTRPVLCKPQTLVNIGEAAATGPAFPFHSLSLSSPLGRCSALSPASPTAFAHSLIPTSYVLQGNSPETLFPCPPQLPPTHPSKPSLRLTS